MPAATPTPERYRVDKVDSCISRLHAYKGKVGTVVRIIASRVNHKYDLFTLNFGNGEKEQFARCELEPVAKEEK